MHVMVFEPRYKGHYLVYLQMVIEALLALGCEVTLGTGTGVPETVEYGARVSALAGKIKVESVATGTPGSARGMYGQFKEILRRVKPDHVLVPSGDGLVQQFGLMRTTFRGNIVTGVEAEALLLRCAFAFPGAGWQQRIKYRAIRQFVKRSGFSRLMTIDAVARESLERLDPGLAGKIELMPDPLDNLLPRSQAEARRLLGIPEDGKYVGLAGALDERKGIDRLIRAFTRARLPADHRLLLAGVAQPPTKELLQREMVPLLRTGQAIWINRYFGDEELGTIIAAMDLVCTPYVEHLGPSAIVAKSAWIGRPVLATDFGWCGNMIPCMGIGWTCDTANEAEFAEMLRLRLEASGVLESTPLLKRWFEYMAPSNFKATWMVRVRKRMGLPPERVLSWNWVINGERT